MGEFVLILTLITSHGVAIHSITMANIGLCKDAGQAWYRVVSNDSIVSLWMCKRRS